MTRHTAFRFSLDPTVEQNAVLLRHVGAARFAFNQSLELHLAARDGRPKTSDSREVPWSGFSLINAFNTWKTSEAAGRRFVVGTDGRAVVEVTGLAWRDQILAQVFEEAAVDLARALRAWTDSRKGLRGGRPVGHPRFKKKDAASGAFRVRSQRSRTGRSSIRLGEEGPRSVTLPKIGSIRVHDDTRRLRRMITKEHARILSATITRGAGGRWWISISVEAADLHPQMRHPSPARDNKTPWVGVDRGLKSAVVAANADGTEVMRVDDAPRALASSLRKVRRLSREVSRKKRGSHNQIKARARLAREHERVGNRRKHFIHQVSNELVKTHGRLVIEDLNITGMLKNKRLSRAISDTAWGELARQIRYKQAWRGGQVIVADRWFPSSKTCSTCLVVKATLTLSEREFSCDACGYTADRDLNAAINLAAWAENHARGDAQTGDRQTAGPVNNAHRRERSGLHHGAGETSLDDVGTGFQTAHAT